MIDNVYIHFTSIRTTLIVVASFLATAGLVSSFTDHWPLATAAWTAAFLCKWIECWLLERALIKYLTEENP